MHKDGLKDGKIFKQVWVDAQQNVLQIIHWSSKKLDIFVVQLRLK